MANPVILVVDDEPACLRAVERELRGHFGAEGGRRPFERDDPERTGAAAGWSPPLR